MMSSEIRREERKDDGPREIIKDRESEIKHARDSTYAENSINSVVDQSTWELR